MLAINVIGDIYQPPLGPGWQLIEGHFSEHASQGFPLSILAQLGPRQNQPPPAQEVDFASHETTFSTVVWWYKVPNSWGGVFYYDDNPHFKSRILFKGWQACS
jgi:hypothetical protein